MVGMLEPDTNLNIYTMRGYLMEVSICTNVIAAMVQDIVVIVVGLVYAVVVVGGDVTTVKEVDVALVVTVAEDVVVVVDQVFSLQ